MPLPGRNNEDDYLGQLARLYQQGPPPPVEPLLPASNAVMDLTPLMAGPRPVDQQMIDPYTGAVLNAGVARGRPEKSAGAGLVQNADVVPPMPEPPGMPRSVQEDVVAIDPLLAGPTAVANDDTVEPKTSGAIGGRESRSGDPSFLDSIGQWLNKPYDAPLAVDKWADPAMAHPSSYEPQPLYGPDGKLTEEGKKQLEAIGPHVAVSPNVHADPFGPPPPPVFAKKPEAKKPAAGGGGGGAASARLSVSGNAGPGGPDWDSPYWTGMAGLSAQADAQGQEQDAIAKGQGDRAALLAKQQADMERMAKDRDDILARHEAEIDRMAKEASSGTIDPDRWWHDRSVPQQISFTIASALSGFRMGLTGAGGPNPTISAMQHAIDNDLAAQKDDILNKHKGVEHAQGLLADMYRRFGRMDVAENAARQVALEQVEAQTQQMVAGAKTEEAKANALILSGALDEKRQEHIYAQWALATKLAAQMAMRRMKTGGKAGTSQKDVRAFGAAVQRLHLGSRGEAVGNLERDLSQGGAPGATGFSGLIAGQKWVPDMFIPDEWIKNRADLDVAKNQATVGLGGRISKSMQELAAKQYGKGGEAGVRHGNEMARRAIEKDWNGLVAQFGPQVAEAYLANDPEGLADLLGVSGGGGGAPEGGGGGGGTEDDLVQGFGDEEQ